MNKVVFSLCVIALVAVVNADIFAFCNNDQSGYTLHVDSLTSDPAIPQSGAKLTVKMNGKLSQPISSGTAKVHIDYAGVELFEGTLDLCSFSSGAFKCPMSPGVQNMTITQTIPDIAPPGGPYTGTIDIKDQSGNQVTCIKLNFEMQ
jgi:hypothetical protein